jgi:hypothetical protein
VNEASELKSRQIIPTKLDGEQQKFDEKQNLPGRVPGS